jgi:DNA repair protein SbcD/Mre11
MKLLLFSDLHLDTPFAWAGPELGRARRNALRDTLRRIIALAGEEHVDALLCGGDLYEQERFSPDTTSFVAEAFGQVDIPVYLAPGNHDWYGPESLYRLANWTPNVHVFTEDHFVPVTLAEGLTLWGAAHRAPANTDGFFETGFVVDRAGVNLALFHGSETAALGFQEGGKAAHAPFSAAQIEDAHLDHAFLGHFHSPRDSARHTYPGNPDPLSFGETGQRGPVLFTVNDDGRITRERFTVAMSHVTSVDVDLTGIASSSDVRDRVAEAVSALSGIVRVTLIGEVGPDVDVHLGDFSGVGPHLDALVPRLGGIGVTYDFAALAQEQTVRGRFVRDVQDSTSLDEDARRRVLVTGLRALDGRTKELEVH